MTALSLLGPNARPMVAIGHGPGVWKSRHIRGILCSFQWIDLRQHGFEDTEDHACVPCMVLMRPGSADRGAHVVPQPHAFLFGDKRGNPTPHLLTSAWSAAETMGFDMRDKQAIRSVIDIIIEALPDLILMPSEPIATLDALVKKHTHGIEMTARINGQKIHEELL